jgi:hypothetical protein
MAYVTLIKVNNLTVFHCTFTIFFDAFENFKLSNELDFYCADLNKSVCFKSFNFA